MEDWVRQVRPYLGWELAAQLRSSQGLITMGWRGGGGVSLVVDLIYMAIKEWKVNVIDNLFYDFEAAIIKNMPLCKTIQDDILIWPFNPNGVYSVKSGYRYLHE